MIFVNLLQIDERFEAELAINGLKIKEVIGDGNCYYRAVADLHLNDESVYNTVRQHACDEMVSPNNYYY